MAENSQSQRDQFLFEKFCSDARAFQSRVEITFEEVPAPQRLAPHAVAFSIDVEVQGDDVATGRFVLLHDPAGQEAWEGKFRAITFIRSAIEEDLQSDPLLTDVAWSWVSESLDLVGASYLATSGTVTKVSSASYGQLSEQDQSSEIEIRASWTPSNSAKLMDHLNAWMRMIETVSGLTPIAEGVSALNTRR
jgi:hypothetical protein